MRTSTGKPGAAPEETVTVELPRILTLWKKASRPHGPSHQVRFELKIFWNGQNQSQS